MKKAFKDIIERLEESKKESYKKYKEAIDGMDIFHYGSITNAYGSAIEIVNQVAEEYKTELPSVVFDKIINFINSEIEKTDSFAEHDTQINILNYVQQMQEEYKQEVCEWKKDKIMSGMYVTCSGYVTYLKDFKYCPYCGKKIKVIGD